MEFVDARYTEWLPCTRNKNEDRSEIMFSLFTREKSICEDLHNEGLTKRIGSESLNAQVFLFHSSSSIELEDEIRYDLALKIMPYSKEKEKEVDKELEISKELSDSGMKFYPYLFKYGECSNVIIKNNSNIDKGRYEDENNSRNKNKNKNKNKFRIIEKAKYGLFELLSHDLGNLINSLSVELYNEEQLFYIIVSVLYAIDDLNNNRGYLHGDLHINNVMFRCSPLEDKLNTLDNSKLRPVSNLNLDVGMDELLSSIPDTPRSTKAFISPVVDDLDDFLKELEENKDKEESEEENKDYIREDDGKGVQEVVIIDFGKAKKFVKTGYFVSDYEDISTFFSSLENRISTITWINNSYIGICSRAILSLFTETDIYYKQGVRVDYYFNKIGDIVDYMFEIKNNKIEKFSPVYSMYKKLL